MPNVKPKPGPRGRTLRVLPPRQRGVLARLVLLLSLLLISSPPAPANEGGSDARLILLYATCSLNKSFLSR